MQSLLPRCALYLTFVLLLPGLARTGEIPLAILQHKIKGKDPEAAKAALAELLARGDEGKSAAAKLLSSLLTGKGKRLNAAGKNLTSAFGILKKKKDMDKVIKYLDQLQKASADLFDYAFDDANYAVPAKAHTGWYPGKDYQKNQIFVEARVEIAVGIYNRLEAALTKCFGKAAKAPKYPGGGNFAKAFRKGELKDNGKALRILQYRFTNGTATWSKFAKTIAKKYKKYRKALSDYNTARELADQAGVESAVQVVPPAPLALAAAAVFSGDYEAAADAMPEAGTPEGRVFDLLVDRHIILRNQEIMKQWERAGRKVFELNNLYRMAVGARPLLANKKIYAATKEHSEWQAAHNKMSHSRPDAKHKTFAERLRLQGYAHPGGENISMVSGINCEWAWRCDAGHHRDLISKDFLAGAMCAVGQYTTYNTGRAFDNEGLDKVWR